MLSPSLKRNPKKIQPEAFIHLEDFMSNGKHSLRTYTPLYTDIKKEFACI